jgi:imidazolonepropionase
MGKIFIKNIKSLLQVREGKESALPVKGNDMKLLPSIENAWLAIEDDLIIDYGKMEDWPGITDWRNLEVIDAEGSFVMPTFVDSHTHTVFATTREEEFVDRIKGLTYQEIAEKGGGILNSAKKLQSLAEDTLYSEAYERLNKIMAQGTGAIEIKSGYGLTPDAELKMLRVIKKLKTNHPLTIKATFLGAHAYPAEFKENHQDYLDLIVGEMLPKINAENLADYVDAFCETNYFSVEETEFVIKEALKFGLKPKVHVNQFTSIGGIQKCVKLNAVSVDHLEIMEENDISVLKNSNVMPTILPSCSFFLSIPYAPARKMIESGLPLALATDFNPGSTPSFNMGFVISLACIKNKMLPEEAINAATLNSAIAMEVERDFGSITIGKKASIIITKPIKNLAYLPYSFGENLIDKVFISGKEI